VQSKHFTEAFVQKLVHHLAESIHVDGSSKACGASADDQDVIDRFHVIPPEKLKSAPALPR
jgi:hypothetical protein